LFVAKKLFSITDKKRFEPHPDFRPARTAAQLAWRPASAASDGMRRYEPAQPPESENNKEAT
jgi:hypothetical protein